MATGWICHGTCTVLKIEKSIVYIKTSPWHTITFQYQLLYDTSYIESYLIRIVICWSFSRNRMGMVKRNILRPLLLMSCYAFNKSVTSEVTF